MVRVLFAFLLAAVAFAANGQDTPAWFAQSLLHLPEDVAEAAKEGKRVMLYFEQNGCPYCKRMVEVNFAEPKIAAQMQRHFVSLAINVWGDREVTTPEGGKTTEKQFAAALKVQFTPTIVFLDEKGGVALRINGYYPPNRFMAALDQAVKASAVPPRAPARGMKPRSGGKPLAVLFEGPKCAACDELRNTTLRHDSVARQLHAFTLEREPLGSGWSKDLRVGYSPTLVLFDADGSEVLRLEAYFRPFHVAGALEYVSSGAWRVEPSFQRFLQARAERLRREGAAVDLWN
jgi:thioredoxin-related protein